MHVFLLGATGYLGTAIGQALLAAGHTVTGLARTEAAANTLRQRGLTPFHGDFADPARLLPAVQAADAVISATTTRDAEQDTAALRAVLDAARGTGKAVIFTSGIWTLGDTGGREADETTPIDPLPVVSWVLPIEEAVRTLPGARGIVLRIGIAHGQGAGFLASFAQAAQAGEPIRYVGTGAQHWPLIHVADIGTLFVAALKKAPAGALYYGVAESVPLRELAEAAARGAGRPASAAVAWPLDEARQALSLFADGMALDQRISNAKARQELGWQPQGPSAVQELATGSYHLATSAT